MEHWSFWKQVKMFFLGGRIRLSNTKTVGYVSVTVDLPRWTWLPKALTYTVNINYENGENTLLGVVGE